MYLPGPWIKEGLNEIVVLDLTGPQSARIAGLKEAILDQLHPEKDLDRPPSKARPKLDGVTPAFEGEFAPGRGHPDRHLRQAGGRQPVLPRVPQRLRWQAVRGCGRDLFAGCKNGKTINQSNWTIAYASSEEGRKEDGQALNAINGQSTDHWHTAFSGAAASAGHPHRLVIDLGKRVEVAGLRYTPRQGAEGVTGRIKQYRAYVGDKLVSED
jgi:beta-galactosidase